jgi:hypothetical protein
VPVHLGPMLDQPLTDIHDATLLAHSSMTNKEVVEPDHEAQTSAYQNRCSKRHAFRRLSVPGQQG